MTWRIVVGGSSAGVDDKDEITALLEGDDRVESVVDVGVGSADDGTCTLEQA